MTQLVNFEDIVKVFHAGSAYIMVHNTTSGNYTYFRFKPKMNWGIRTSMVYVEALLVNKEKYDMYVRNGVMEPHVKWNLTDIGLYCFKRNIFWILDDENRSLFVSDQTYCNLISSFLYVKNRIISGLDFPKYMEVWNMDVCARCGRQLTNYESLNRFFGEECLKYYKQKTKDFQFKLGLNT